MVMRRWNILRKPEEVWDAIEHMLRTYMQASDACKVCLKKLLQHFLGRCVRRKALSMSWSFLSGWMRWEHTFQECTLEEVQHIVRNSTFSVLEPKISTAFELKSDLRWCSKAVCAGMCADMCAGMCAVIGVCDSITDPTSIRRYHVNMPKAIHL